MTTIIAFLKSRTFIIIVGVILLILLFSIKQCQRKVLIEKINTLEVTNAGINQDRIALENLLKVLQNNFNKITESNDSLKLVLIKYQKELSELKKSHAQEIVELLKVPNDTVFMRLQPLFPNYDNSLLKYPFSGSQIRGIYSTAISYGMVQQEYSLQSKSLNTCLRLNTGYEKGIANLTDQVVNLQGNVDNADLQIKNYNKEVTILNKQIARKGFFNKTLIGGIAVAVLVIIFK